MNGKKIVLCQSSKYSGLKNQDSTYWLLNWFRHLTSSKEKNATTLLTKQTSIRERERGGGADGYEKFRQTEAGEKRYEETEIDVKRFL